MAKWINAKTPGIRYREHDVRKHGARKDRYFAIYYRVAGKRKEEALGWASKGWSEKKQILFFQNLKRTRGPARDPDS